MDCQKDQHESLCSRIIGSHPSCPEAVSGLELTVSKGVGHQRRRVWFSLEEVKLLVEAAKQTNVMKSLAWDAAHSAEGGPVPGCTGIRVPRASANVMKWVVSREQDVDLSRFLFSDCTAPCVDGASSLEDSWTPAEGRMPTLRSGFWAGHEPSFEHAGEGVLESYRERRIPVPKSIEGTLLNHPLFQKHPRDCWGVHLCLDCTRHCTVSISLQNLE